MNDIQRARLIRVVRKTHSEKESEMLGETATMFGHRIGMALAAGIPLEESITLAQEHFRILAGALIEFANVPTEVVISGLPAAHGGENEKL